MYNEGCDGGTGDQSLLRSPWNQTKAEHVLQEAQAHEDKHKKTVCNKIQGSIS